MKIVILDSYAANPGDLSWDEVKSLGEVDIYEHCGKDAAEVIRRCAGAEVAIVNKVRFTAEIMDALPQLKIIALLSTGYDIVDTAAAAARGIIVCNVPGYSTMSVAQLTFALLFELVTGVQRQSDEVHAGAWSAAPDFTFYCRPIIELAGKTLGVFGFGSIGQTVAKIGADLGMTVIYAARHDKNSPFAQRVSTDELFRCSDVLSLHAPQTPETRHLVNRERLAMMKPTAFLINTARGGLVDGAALADALNSGRLAGAGVDVLETEPPAPDYPLLNAKNCVITPHVAWASFEARQRLLHIVAENIRLALAGTPQNKVN